jgi:two-component system phosphate regulon response regulator PhoB
LKTKTLTTLLRYNLDAEGYEVETVACGDDADTRLKERVPDLIIAGLDAAGASPASSCAGACRRGRRPAQLPIIMLTAQARKASGAGTGNRCRRLHCKAVLGAGAPGA